MYSIWEMILKFLDWFLPDNYLENLSDGERVKTRAQNAFFVFCSIAPLFYIALGLEYDLVSYLVFIGFSLIPISMLFLAKVFQLSPATKGIAITTILSFGFFTFSLMEKNIFTTTFNWFPLIPVAGVFFVGYRWGVFTGLAVMAYVFAYHHFFKHLGFHLGDFPSFEELSYANLFDQTLSIFFMTLLASLYEVSRQRDQKEFLQAQKELMGQKQKSFHVSRLTEIGEIAGGVAHEVNNPLAIIQGSAQRIEKLVKEGKLDQEKLLKSAAKIQYNTNRINQIISGLKNFSKDGSGNYSDLVSINDLFSEIGHIYSEKCLSLGIQFYKDIGREEVFVLGQKADLFQAIMNLVRNSKQEVQDRVDAWIKISCEVKEHVIEISVIDSGAGIESGLEEKVFQPFFTTKPIGEATGMGLSVTQGIVEAHKGRVFINRTNGDSRVSIQLPKIEFCILPADHFSKKVA